MNHLPVLKLRRNQGLALAQKSLLARATGKFYTPATIGNFLAENVVKLLAHSPKKRLSVIDPFSGDGRLVWWLIECAEKHGIRRSWDVTLWDTDEAALEEASRRAAALPIALRRRVNLKSVSGDAFALAKDAQLFDLVVTNPPWDALKPDRRELDQLSGTDQERYIAELRALDQRLAADYPRSQPQRKFAGWGTNLSRVGAELAEALTVPDGIVAMVLPASTFADQVSVPLRKWLLGRLRFTDVGYFAAESRLFTKVDQSSMVAVAQKFEVQHQHFELHTFRHETGAYDVRSISPANAIWEERDFCIPFTISGATSDFFDALGSLPSWSDVEGGAFGLWCGRELDETRIATKFSEHGQYRFLKGRMVGRFQLIEQAVNRIDSRTTRIPRSADLRRIAWRDVSRPTQQRRMHATLVDPGFVTGNSLNIALFEPQFEEQTYAMLGVMNSLVFETQIRARSTTSHISLGLVRGVKIPDLRRLTIVRRLSEITRKCIGNPTQYEHVLEVAVAKAYGLKKSQFAAALESFPGLSSLSRDSLLKLY
ncbi:Alw26I/Eco31I/Esp3I family type II restriction adenine-specific DNA-methyltransferase [Burkholderia pseudomallei]|uniref:Alw26I/Eco31I/Esp3I family type II restriction adenine-specific DNA-methyltransferase n=1 Tax=Burkholderia pseudomallei TaxID=28450 RepID=UPI002DBE7A9E|nr:Alw26I/Eco31I/Esp3I family type II restriction adenine-specific DNA-methyltransferase [Burkholderia pseudomallei]MEB5483496.1 Alw26I/Eco31I/Esp3I family type II restriction adenine-specific DNA-methyltransferase [Burkholderia pseudomallei]MEB5490243.1 Alw26I/Eco31I/Esp3I family type II restriction adenine-specific DNA-methyltransferase [Burkholderia pseudomallei]MEB5496929.1 Alw26I/Eco31I/Esp3I family type II restriction adenine-specific DNA-methyltransferase [Burkholderia pseudomallei]MEB55